jgi:hypothetical protein
MDVTPPLPAPMAVVEVDYVVEKFREACTRGQAQFGTGQIKPIDYKDIVGIGCGFIRRDPALKSTSSICPDQVI